MRQLTLIGDSIENPWNALAMMHAAGMVGSACLFRDHKHLSAAWHETITEYSDLPRITLGELEQRYPAIVALDNSDGASEIYGFRPTKPGPIALVVGNERLGISRDIGRVAHDAVEIPMVSRQMNCLNVAAAAAVGLYYLARGGGRRLQTRNDPQRRRPDLLLMGAGNPVELGSSIRSACAFGWERALVEDRCGVWFGCDRITRSEGRGAARRGRNPIRLIPANAGTSHAYRTVVVVTVAYPGTPLQQANLSHGKEQLIVIPDEGEVRIDEEDWERLGRSVEFVHLDLPASDFVYHYRLIATIAMAEAARQVGRTPRKAARERGRRKPVYEKALQALLEERGELVFLEELEDY
jgi:tRNA G18 (ribose-2'-O)-methylase SpoU